MKVMGFQTKKQLEKYLADNAIVLAKIAAVYFDSASGEHVLVYSTI